jgi:hypothetical protein
MENRGSEWRKWDLHLHTPGTAINDKFKLENNTNEDELWKEYCKRINSSGVSVVGITDYGSVDNYIFLKKNRDNFGLNKDVVLFPNIELRVSGITSSKSTKELGGTHHVNLHIILSDKVEVNKMEKLLREIADEKDNGVKINIKDDYNDFVEQNKFNRVPTFNNVIEALKNTFGNTNDMNYLLMTPNSNDGINISKEGTGIKNNIDAFKKIDIIQSSNEKDGIFFLSEEILKETGKNYPCIHASDAHELDHVCEPQSENKPNKKYTWIKADTTFEGLISITYEPETRVKIQENMPEKKLSSKIIDFIQLNEELGNSKIYLNQNLNTVIGGRSSGKSLLLSFIAKKLDSSIENVKNNSDSYEKKVDKLLENIEVKMKDGSTSTPIDFFYQGKLQEIARDKSKIKVFVEEIISSYDSFENINVFNNKLETKKYNLNLAINKFSSLREEINDLVIKQSNTQNVNKIKSNITELKTNINSLESDYSEDEKKENKDILEKENKNSIEMQKVIENCEILERVATLEAFKINSELENEISKLKEMDSIETNINIFIDKINYINDEIRTFIAKELEQLTQKYSELDIIKEEIENNTVYKRIKKDEENNQELSLVKEELVQEIEKLKIRKEIDSRLEENFKKIDLAKEEIAALFSLDDILVDINDREVFSSETEKLIIRSKYYLKIDLLNSKLKETINTHLNLFKQELPDEYALNENDTNIVYNVTPLKYDTFIKYLLTKEEYAAIFKNSKTVIDTLNSLSNFLEFKLEYEIEYDGTSFEDMSEGKKSFVLLLLQLSSSKNKFPILIDQPEDDLDNRAIYEELVKYLKVKKSERQFIIVTHNANVVIAADSENIIVANQDGVGTENKNGVKHQYISGSIENTYKKDSECILEKQGIREHICDILEGGEVAFKKRKEKYKFF